MVNRPLPAIPMKSDNLPDHRASPRLRNWTSLDDDVIPHHTRSTLQSRQRDSPKRRPQRPQSEVFLDRGKVFGGALADQPGVYIYGYKSQTEGQISQNMNFSPVKLQTANISPTHLKSMQQAQHQADLRLRHSLSPKGTGYDNMQNMQNMKNGKSSSPIHFQNGSPSHTSGTSTGDSTESSPVKTKTSG